MLDVDGTVAPYDKRVYPSEVFAPASVILGDKFYVLTTVAPTDDGTPTIVLRSLSVGMPTPVPVPEADNDGSDTSTDGSERRQTELMIRGIDFWIQRS